MWFQQNEPRLQINTNVSHELVAGMTTATALNDDAMRALD
jgi:hypothetical protein